MEGRKEGGRQGGCSQCTAGRDALSRTETHTQKKLGGMLHKTQYTMDGRCLFPTGTSRNLTKRFRENNSDLKTSKSDLA